MASETELPLEFIDAKLPRMPFPLQNAEGDQTTGDVMQLGPLRAGLTAAKAEVPLTHPDDFLNLGAHPIELTHFCGR